MTGVTAIGGQHRAGGAARILTKAPGGTPIPAGSG